ncbi:MAG TPA: NAD(P)/FAD-dependent oxidoreductase [Lamprocystis sp. (in: g-proteobacteria)]|nr:NAD(P)/FAD-dependent oxidoreductase [Lamprocystis sp. (in: g-proteobacteria)]
MSVTTDICIIGGGPAGSVLAARLAQFGLGVCLVERVSFPRRHWGESLTPGVLPLLKSIGAGPALERARYPRGRRVHRSWGAEQGWRDPDGQGLLVDRGHFDGLLLEHARACGVRILQPALLEGWGRGAAGWRLTVRSERRRVEFEVRMLADASGRAGALGRRRHQTGPTTLALHGYWTGRGLPEHPRIEAGADAWFWGVPLPDGAYNTLVFIDPRDLRAMPGTLADKFRALIATSSLLPRGGGVDLHGPVHATDATPYLAADCVTRDSIRVGDAGLALDPLSSSGVQRAIQSALLGAVVVNTLLERPQAAGMAQQFYRDHLAEASGRHRIWARGHYAQVADTAATRFWRERAETPLASAITPPEVAPPIASPIAGSTPLDFAPGLDIVDLPCVVDRFIEPRPAVRHPRLTSPVAFLGEVELAPLLRCVRRGMTPPDLVRAWMPRVPPQQGSAIAEWLVSRGLLVPQPMGAVAIGWGRA